MGLICEVIGVNGNDSLLENFEIKRCFDRIIQRDKNEGNHLKIQLNIVEWGER